MDMVRLKRVNIFESIALRVGNFWPRWGEVTPGQAISKQISIDRVGSPCDRLVWPERPQGASPASPLRSLRPKPSCHGRALLVKRKLFISLAGQQHKTIFRSS